MFEKWSGVASDFFFTWSTSRLRVWAINIASNVYHFVIKPPYRQPTLSPMKILTILIITGIRENPIDRFQISNYTKKLIRHSKIFVQFLSQLLILADFLVEISSTPSVAAMKNAHSCFYAAHNMLFILSV